MRKDIRAAMTCTITKMFNSTVKPRKFVTIQPLLSTKPAAMPKLSRINHDMQSNTK